MKKTLFVTGLILMFTAGMAFGQEVQLPKGLQGASLNGTYYLNYQAGDTPTGSYNRFNLSRGYLILNKSFNDNFKSRIATDIYQSGGNWNTRLKYLYGKYSFGDMGFLTQVNVEAGLVHTTWLDFEESINRHRCQGTMFMERSGLFNSADIGFTFGGNFGGELDANYKKTVNSHYAGTWGSFQVGMYNGGGYHAAELNENKVVQARVSVRPLPGNELLQGMQVTYLGIFGKGNVAATADQLPDYLLTALMLSFETAKFTVTGQYAMGNGNASGTNVDATDASEANPYAGFSVFANYRFLEKYDALVRYENFDPNTDTVTGAGGVEIKNSNTRMIIGAGRKLDANNYMMVDYQIDTPEDSNIDPSTQFQVTWFVHF